MKWQSLVPEFPRLRTKRGWKIEAGAKLDRAIWINKLLGKGWWGIPSQGGAAAHGTSWVTASLVSSVAAATPETSVSSSCCVPKGRAWG